MNGKYLAVFEDGSSRGSRRWVYCVELIQEGAHITGSTAVDGKEFVIEAMLHWQEHISGIIFAAERGEDWMYGVFLHKVEDEVWEGSCSLYAGRDFGFTIERISLVRSLDLSLEPPSEREVQELRWIIDAQIGRGYVEVEQLRDPLRLIYAGKFYDTVVGVGMGKLFPVSTLLERLQLEDAAAISQLEQLGRIGLIETVATAPGYEGFGIGCQVTTKLITELEARGAGFFVVIAWKSPDRGVHIGGILDRLGFSAVAEVPEFWREDSLARHTCCSYCGSPPCTCTAVIYTRSVAGSTLATPLLLKTLHYL